VKRATGRGEKNSIQRKKETTVPYGIAREPGPLNPFARGGGKEKKKKENGCASLHQTFGKNLFPEEKRKKNPSYPRKLRSQGYYKKRKGETPLPAILFERRGERRKKHIPRKFVFFVFREAKTKKRKAPCQKNA